jgi:penicillin-binding protein 1C
MNYRFLKHWSPRKKILLGIVLFSLVAYVFCLPRQLFHAPYSTVVTDRDGELLGARIASDGQWRFPPRDDVPPKMEQCLVAFEDKRFRHHWGVDPLALGRAIYTNLKRGRVVSGGSTLTMQTIRIARDKPRTLWEKMVEMIWATRLEFRASKREILAMYVSHAPFGGNVVGLDAAAWRYFGHPADELSWAEAATLAVLPNSPSLIHLAKGRDALLAKRDRLLKLLLDDGKIDPSAYELALAEPLPGEPRPLPRIAPYLVSRYHQEREGEYIRTTIDRGIQQRMEALAERRSDEFGRSDIRNLAILVIDLPSGQPVAYVGNTHYERQQRGNQVDIIRSPRSTGSILKPFLYYAMLREGTLLPTMLVPDIPIHIGGFTPQNFNMRFEGAVPANEALARSLNIPAVSELREYGVPKLHSLLRQIGLTTLNKPPSHYGLSLILGGAEATLWDVTNAYARMGRSLLPGDTVPDTFAWDKGAVWQTFDALTEVNRPEEIDWHSIPSMQPIAYKTGTSYGFRDAWAVGVTPRYAVGVWVGNATGEGKPGLVGALTAGPVLFDAFSALPSSTWFERPRGVFVEAEICRQSGHPRGRFCDEVDTLLILPAGSRADACPFHQLVTLTADGKRRVYENCANAEPTIQQSWFSLPPVWEWYYKQYHPEYRPLPPFKAGCGDGASQPMQFIYPSMGARVRLPKQLDGSPGTLTVELAHGDAAATVFWHLDDSYVARTCDFHKITIHPAPGRHSLTAVDDEGNTLSTVFYIE